VPLISVDPLYFDRSYFLARQGGPGRTRCCRRAARDAPLRHRTLAAHGRDHMIVLRPLDKALVMHQLHFAPRYARSTTSASCRRGQGHELKLARQLIDQQATDKFDPTLYVDEVKARVEAAIQKKVEGKQISLSATPQRASSATSSI